MGTPRKQTRCEEKGKESPSIANFLRLTRAASWLHNIKRNFLKVVQTSGMEIKNITDRHKKGLFCSQTNKSTTAYQQYSKRG